MVIPEPDRDGEVRIETKIEPNSAIVPITAPEPTTINFCTEEDGIVGTLHVGPPMRFEGDVERSAEIFFELLIKNADAL